MASRPEGDTQEPDLQETVADFFRGSVQRLLQDNLDYVLSGSLGGRRNVETLQLIDPEPQPGVKLDYHCVYTSFDSVRQITTHGLYIANPWRRQTYEPAKESRHYFDGGNDLVVREDTHRQSRHFEFMRGYEVDPEEITDPELAALFAGLHDDIANIWRSQPIKPLQLAFNQFARRK